MNDGISSDKIERDRVTGGGFAPATMAQIAKLVGVSKVSVSAVLTSSPGNNTRVAPATRERILKAARELNYAPNSIAKMFRRKRTDTIGLYLGDVLLNTHDVFLAEIVSGLQVGCKKYQKDLLIHGATTDESVEDVFLSLTSRKVDGLVVFAEEDDALALRLATSSLPVIAIADVVPSLPSVVADDRAGSALIAEYLAAQGHKSVLYRRGHAYQSSAQRRYHAFIAAADRLGITVVDGGERDFDRHFEISTAEQRLLSDNGLERPTAVVCTNDRLAFAAYEYCQTMGIHVPGKLAIVGFDGFVPQLRPIVALTTVRAPWTHVAQVAVDLIMRKLDGDDIPFETVLPVELVIGKTA